MGQGFKSSCRLNMNTCLNCKKALIAYQKKFCSNKCQSAFKYLIYVANWKTGLVDGNRGKITKNISEHIRKYITKKFGEKCSLCSWSEKNPKTNSVPLEIDHIDGNSENNHEKNLRLICPNCHSLSANFRNLNKGKGRVWRKIINKTKK